MSVLLWRGKEPRKRATKGTTKRFVKLAMLRSTRAVIFIDSDNLEDLDVLFGIARTQMQVQVILLIRVL